MSFTVQERHLTRSYRPSASSRNSTVSARSQFRGSVLHGYKSTMCAKLQRPATISAATAANPLVLQHKTAETDLWCAAAQGGQRSYIEQRGNILCTCTNQQNLRQECLRYLIRTHSAAGIPACGVLQNQHTIAVAVETVLLPDRFLVCMAHKFNTRERAHHHDQR